MSKKFASFLTAVLVAVSVPAFASSASADTGSGYWYTVTGGEVTITSCENYICPTKVLVIPSTLGGKPVTAIASSAFAWSGLTSVTIPASVTTIGLYAFKGNPLTWASFEGDAPTGDLFFGDNPDLAFIDVPSGLTSWAEQPDSYGSPVSAQFFATRSLGNSSTSIDGCDRACPEDLVIPSTIAGFTVNAIGWLGLSGLKSVTIPASVTEIYDYAFSGNSLTSVRFEGNAPTYVGELPFDQNPNLTYVDVPDESTGWGSTFAGLTVRRSVTYVTDADNNMTVTGCDRPCPADLVIPAMIDGRPVTAIADNAFKGVGITSVVLPDSLVSVGAWAFENNSLTAVTLPSSLTTLNAGAFYINALVSVEVPSSVTTVGDYAFAKNALTSFTFKGNAPSEGGNVFANDPDLLAVDVSYGTTGWGATFSGTPVHVLSLIHI